MAILLMTFTITDAMLCTALISHVHAVTLTQGPTCPPLGCSPSILAISNNARAVVFTALDEISIRFKGKLSLKKSPN